MKCRECDKQMVSAMIKKAREEYATVYGEGAPEVKVDEKDFLNPPPVGEDDDPALTWSVPIPFIYRIARAHPSLVWQHWRCGVDIS